MEQHKNKEKVKLVVFVGPTAVGKTEVSLQLAQRLDGEIISADSRLFYRGMDIGTAKPTLMERLKVPHHLVDVANPDEVWSLALFQQRAMQAIDDVAKRGKLPFLVGGTGQYIRAVVQGWEIPQVEPDTRLRTMLEKWGQEIGFGALHERLAVVDPQAAERIDPRNVRRTIRALEVILTTGKKFSDQRVRSDPTYDYQIIGLTRPREELYARVDARIDVMIAGGWVEETRQLLEKGYSKDLPSLSAIGYREIIAYLLGEISLEDAIVMIKRNTRVFVRRQANWFKQSDPEITWFSVEANVIDQMERFIYAWNNSLVNSSPERK